LYLKIGMGNTPLEELPWIGVTDIEIVKNSIDTYLGSGTGIGQIENITKNYLDSKDGTDKFNEKTKKYLDSDTGIS
jgi:hypothetical protein